MAIVKGFTDIIAPQNLATNGSFRINQRGLFTSGLADAKLGDYVSDAWFVAGISTDYCQVHNSISAGTLRLAGYGKKGQAVYVRNKDLAIRTVSEKLTMRATLTIAAGSVPVVSEMRVNNAQSTSYNKNASLSIKKLTDVSVCCATTATTSSEGYVGFLLLADGAFDVTISDVGVFSGEFVNPPAKVIVPYADDLLRCKRYYQRGSLFNRERCTQYTSTWGVSQRGLVLPVEMAGTPTTVTLGYNIFVLDGAGNETSAGTATVVPIDSKQIDVQIKVSDPTHGPSSISYGVRYTVAYACTV